jgi:hypothetical protein
MNVEKHVLLMHTTSASVNRTKRDAAHRQHSAILCTTSLPCGYSFVPFTFYKEKCVRYMTFFSTQYELHTGMLTYYGNILGIAHWLKWVWSIYVQEHRALPR